MTNEHSDAQEGFFDTQLSLFLEGPAPLTIILKRDGRAVPFEKSKIADTIFRAAQTIAEEDRDRAEQLASAVAIYLTKARMSVYPSVDEIADAVQRVLVEMGHARTARAYAHHRERRERARALQKPPVRSRNALIDAFTDETLVVRSSTDTLEPWDRSRIVTALVRETRLDAPTAETIAAEVEEQIVTARLQQPSAALIREMVGARLIAHGLEQHHRRHMRLGVPLYDVDRILRGPHEMTPQDPESTGQLLAEAVKREYALTHVFSPTVADAHVRGELHIHDLGAVDRLHSAVQSVESLTRFGVGAADGGTFSSPPHFAETLLAQMAKASAVWQRYYCVPAAWDAVNVFFAPFLDTFDQHRMKQLAQMLVYEFACYGAQQDPGHAVTELSLSWNIPARLCTADAIGAGGLPTERTYDTYTNRAQQFAWAMLEILQEEGARGLTFRAPQFVIDLSPAFFQTEGHGLFLEHAAKAALLHGNIVFRMERDLALVDDRDPWEPREVTVSRVTINLARVAHHARDMEIFFKELRELVPLALQAHVEKYAFIQQLLDEKEAGTLALLAAPRAGRPRLDLQRTRAIVGVAGLSECVQVLRNRLKEHTPDLATHILAALRANVADIANDYGINAVVGETRDAVVTRRFASLDLREFPDTARSVIKTDPLSFDLQYTAGLRLETNAIPPLERVRREGELHDFMDAGARTCILLEDLDLDARSLADFIEMAYRESQCHSVFFTHTRLTPDA